jgi:formylglycine-generating enzyme required for sulfatase activity
MTGRNAWPRVLVAAVLLGASAGEPSLVAVLGFTGVKDSTLLEIVTDAARNGAVRAVRGSEFRVVDRAKVEKLQEEARKNCGGDDVGECDALVAKYVHATLHVSGDLKSRGKGWYLSVALYDTKNNTVIASRTVQADSEKLLVSGAEKAVEELVREGLSPVGVAAPDPVVVAPTRQGKGTLKVVTDPSGAQVRVDGEEVGKTPWKKKVASGQYLVTLEKDGFTPVSKQVEVEAGREVALIERLMKSGGWLDISVTPLDAEVSVDGRSAGTGKQGPYAVGRHTVRAEARGYKAGEQGVEVEDGATASVRMELSAQPGRVLVSVNVESECEAGGAEATVSPGKVGVLEVAAGRVTVTCRREGYAEVSETVSVAAGKAADVKLNLKKEDAPSGMVKIPGGTFMMGSTDGDADEKPVHKVTLSAFLMDKTEVTVAQYAACVKAGACSPASLTVQWKEVSDADRTFGSQFCNGNKADKQNHPVNCVDWPQAETFCRWRGGRLPTEAEWEYAARGTDGRKFPWGNNEPGPTQLNACGSECTDMLKRQGRGEFKPMYSGSDGWEATSPVGTYPSGGSPYGLLDMAGNVWEWTSDWKGDYPSGDQTNPQGAASGTARVVRGGSWGVDLVALVRVASRYYYDPSNRYDYVGFRCARGSL